MLNRHFRTGILVLATAVLFGLAPVSAQEADQGVTPATGRTAGSGAIHGKITLADGKTPAAGAVVMAYHLESGRTASSQPADAQGRFEISGLPFGYVDLAVKTAAGLYVANQVVNVPPSGKIAINFSLQEFPEETSSWWDRHERKEFPGDTTPATGMAKILKRHGGVPFWKTPKGIAVIGGGAGALLLAVSSGGGGENPASPFTP